MSFTCRGCCEANGMRASCSVTLASLSANVASASANIASLSASLFVNCALRMAPVPTMVPMMLIPTLKMTMTSRPQSAFLRNPSPASTADSAARLLPTPTPMLEKRRARINLDIILVSIAATHLAKIAQQREAWRRWRACERGCFCRGHSLRRVAGQTAAPAVPAASGGAPAYP
ncbi:hypothetical protein T492DRAFT_978753 [Pavlovales sp. CCMP2436]|nr:hypothetical protein T492DRAFT_978753 [Pavlovales sp. CCMP2436]